jgi:hypothetical protein
MALLFLDGFEGYASATDMLRSSAPTRWGSVTYSSTSFNAATYRTTQPTAANSRSFSSVGFNGYNYAKLITPSATELIMGCGFYYTQTANNNENGIFLVANYQSWSQGVVLSINPFTGSLRAGIPNASSLLSTVLGTSGTSVSPNVWHHVEMRVKCHATAGEIEVYLNGVQVINVASVNTATGGIADYREIYSMVYNSSYGPTFLIDDFYLCDKSGTTNNTFLGPIGVYSLMPTANASSTQLTPTGVASNWDAVNDTSPDTTTYVATTTTGNKDYYTFESLPAGVTQVAGVQLKSMNTMPIGGPRKLLYNIKNGANVISSSLKALFVGTWVYDSFVADKAPDNTAWTPAKVNASEYGIEAG